MDETQLALAMDKQQPDWWIAYADEQDLKDTLRAIFDARNGVNRISKAEEHLRRSVVRRLFMPCRAAVHAGLLKEA